MPGTVSNSNSNGNFQKQSLSVTNESVFRLSPHTVVQEPVIEWVDADPERVSSAVTATQRMNWTGNELVNHTCAACQKLMAKGYTCVNCVRVTYCDAKCQREHWRLHKTDCKQT